MKKAAVCLILIALIAGLAAAFAGTGNATQNTGTDVQSEIDTENYLRVHIRANSNKEEDQAVKYLVRDSVVEFLTPTVAGCESKTQAIAKIGAQLSAVEEVARRVLRENGFSYPAKATLRKEQFPTRVYESATLPAGVYDALILELGTGTGDNWWCVVYPPLCFSGGNANFVYKSKIKEIIDRFFAN